MVRGTFTINTRLELARLTRRQRKPNEVVLSKKTVEFQLLSDQQVWGPQLDTTDDLDTCNKNLTTIVMEAAVPRQEKLSIYGNKATQREAAADEEKWDRCATYRIHFDLQSHQTAFERGNQQLQWGRTVKSTDKQQRSQGHQKKAEPREKQHCYPYGGRPLKTIEDRGRLISDFYNGATSVLKLHRDNDKIKLERGAREGDNISPKLLTACVQDAIIKRLDCMGR